MFVGYEGKGEFYLFDLRVCFFRLRIFLERFRSFDFNYLFWVESFLVGYFFGILIRLGFGIIEVNFLKGSGEVVIKVVELRREGRLLR